MRQNSDLKIIIADNSEVFREGFKAIIKNESGIQLDYLASSCTQLLEILKSGYKPDVILFDISMEDDEFLPKLNRDYPEVRIIILSHKKEIRYIVKAVHDHVRAYLAKDSSAGEIISTIKAVNEGGGVYFGETISSDILIKGFGNSKNILNGKPYELSPREFEILKMLATGYSVKEISTKLSIGITTVESYKERIKNKLGVNTIMEAVVFAVKCELF